MSTATIAQPSAQKLQIAITRLIDGTPEEVFEAWVSPTHLSRWWGPREGQKNFSTPHVETSPQPGGTFRTCIRSPRGQDYWARGVFEEIRPPHRLAFTHGWEDNYGRVPSQRQATVDFIEAIGKTRLTFLISGYDATDSCDSEVEGWSECIDRLVEYFACGQGAPIAYLREQQGVASC